MSTKSEANALHLAWPIPAKTHRKIAGVVAEADSDPHSFFSSVALFASPRDPFPLFQIMELRLQTKYRPATVTAISFKEPRTAVTRKFPLLRRDRRVRKNEKTAAHMVIEADTLGLFAAAQLSNCATARSEPIPAHVCLSIRERQTQGGEEFALEACGVR